MLIVYRDKPEFGVLILELANLCTYFINSSVNYLGFSILKSVLPGHIVLLLFYLFFFFSFSLIALKLPAQWLIVVVKVGIHILFLIFGRRLSVFYHWVCYFLCFFHKCYLSYWGSTFLLVIFWETLLLNNVEFCQMPLIYQLMIQCLFFFFCFNLLFGVWIDFLMSNHSCFPGINSTS